MLLTSSTLLFVLAWLPRKLLSRLADVAMISVRGWPAVTPACLDATVWFALAGSDDDIPRLGRLTAYSKG